MSVAFIIFAQTAIPVHPAKTALNYPSLGQNLEAFDVIRPFDNLNRKTKLLLHPLLPFLARKATICPDLLQ